jgi:5,10-methylene-tetrahydrofolate dehydrogenase/methenyl tetrahydrofolate cyclohydrolase
MILETEKAKYFNYPMLAYVLVGSDPSSEIYIKTKSRVCEEIGIKVEGVRLDIDAT